MFSPDKQLPLLGPIWEVRVIVLTACAFLNSRLFFFPKRLYTRGISIIAAFSVGF